MTEQSEPPRIDIWGSCVSRDTVEHMLDVNVGTYVARQSAIVSLGAATGVDIPFDRLDSEFQRRMLNGDKRADVTQRLNDDATLLLIDLVDERRGVWSFPSGGYLTNSVEAFKTGISDWAPQLGGRLIEFGTDEHYRLWQNGFVAVTRQLAQTRVPAVLLDIAWAEVADGQNIPHGVRAFGGSVARRLKRGSRMMTREITKGQPLTTAARLFVKPGMPKTEVLAAESRRQNKNYRRYIEFAQRHVSGSIRRSSAHVRMDTEHKWGVGPYHYRKSDYLSIANDIRAYLRGDLPPYSQGKKIS